MGKSLMRNKMRWKKTLNFTTQKMWEKISGGKAHSNTRKHIRDILTITNVFLDQKRVNVCEHTVKMAPSESF